MNDYISNTPTKALAYNVLGEMVKYFKDTAIR